jgi:GH18 family chitinase
MIFISLCLLTGNQPYRVVCYVEGWAVYRKEPMRFTSLDLDPFACTHLVYAFATLDPHSFTIMPQDEEYDIVKGKTNCEMYFKMAQLGANEIIYWFY